MLLFRKTQRKPISWLLPLQICMWIWICGYVRNDVSSSREKSFEYSDFRIILWLKICYQVYSIISANHYRSPNYIMFYPTLRLSFWNYRVLHIKLSFGRQIQRPQPKRAELNLTHKPKPFCERRDMSQLVDFPTCIPYNTSNLTHTLDLFLPYTEPKLSLAQDWKNPSFIKQVLTIIRDHANSTTTWQ